MLFGSDQPRTSKEGHSTEEFGSSGWVGLELTTQGGCLGLRARIHDASRFDAEVRGFDANCYAIRVEKRL